MDFVAEGKSSSSEDISPRTRVNTSQDLASHPLLSRRKLGHPFAEGREKNHVTRQRTQKKTVPNMLNHKVKKNILEYWTVKKITKNDEI